MKSIFCVLLALAMISTSAPASAAAGATSEGSPLAYYLVMRRMADGAIEVVNSQVVEMSAPLETLDDAGLARALQENGESYIVRLVDQNKQVRFQTVAHIPSLLRGEFQEQPGDALESHLLPLKEAAFVVRVPVIAGARLTVADAYGKNQAEFSLDELARGSAQSKTVYPVTTLQLNGSPQNRLDIVILGDGYTSSVADQNKFLNDATLLANGFFNVTPLNEYRSYHNVYAIYSPSNQAGADHPLYNATCVAGDPTCCGDSIMATDPLNGQMVDTIFDSTFCYYNIYRLLVAMDYTDIYNVAASMPDWDVIMVVVNDSTYGGSGGWVAVLSTNPAAVEIAKHEYGHTFGLLADEYDYGTPGSCNDLDGDPYNDCAGNVTNATAYGQIKWNKWIPPDATLPSPEDGSYPYTVGLFRGAFYDPVNFFRPGLNCLMQNLYQPFCHVPSELMVRRLYQGGWGAPANGIEMIEPGTELPATSTVNMKVGDTEIFKATLLNPMVPVVVAWQVNGVVQAGFYSNSFPFTPGAPGSYTITLRVLDNGPFIHPLDMGITQDDQHSWTVNAWEMTYLPMLMVTTSGKIERWQPLERFFHP